MRKSTKAALLSGLLFPGLGQLFLRMFVTGTILALVALVAGYLVVATVWDIVSGLLADIERGALGLDVNRLRLEIESRVLEAGPRYAYGKILLLLVWLAGIVHAIIAGRGQERDSENNKRQQRDTHSNLLN